MHYHQLVFMHKTIDKLLYCWCIDAATVNSRLTACCQDVLMYLCWCIYTMQYVKYCRNCIKQIGHISAGCAAYKI